MRQDVYIIDGARTPFLKARNRPGPFAASDLATAAGRAVLTRQPFAPTELDEVILGCAAPSVDEVNIGRVVALRMGCGQQVPGWTVMRNCASGMQALDSAIANFEAGRSELVLAGGVDALSRAPLLYSDAMVLWFADFYAARTFGQKAAALARFRPAYLAPVYDGAGNVYTADDGVRKDSTAENLAKLRPFFDRKYGNVTAGNSSQVTDGGAWALLATEAAVKRHGLKPVGRIVDSQWAGLDPSQMGLGPVHAATPILRRQALSLNDLDAWEINEAFAAQVLACLEAWKSDEYCRNDLGLDRAMGELDLEKLNVDGGAIALGHPVGASGARIVLHLLHVLKRSKGKRGMATICIGGGQGGAMLVEAL